MRRNWRVLITGAIVAAGSLLVEGCLIRTYPIPPPTAERTSALTCAPPMCPNGGVTVTIVGDALPGSLVVAENISRPHADGHRYVASAWAQPGAIGDAGGADAGDDAGVSNPGHYTIVLSPETDPDGSVTVSQVGDQIAVVQFVRNDEGYYQQSGSLMLTVQAP